MCSAMHSLARGVQDGPKQGLIKQGQFYLSKLSESQLRERMFFGSAIPCVRTLRTRGCTRIRAPLLGARLDVAT